MQGYLFEDFGQMVLIPHQRSVYLNGAKNACSFEGNSMVRELYVG